jgi:lipopolysaccharide transport system permease protein
MKHWLELILYKARADLKVEASQGYLGMLWWVLEPVLYMGAFYIIFAVALQRGGEHFVPWLLIGLVVWKWFDTSVRMSASSIRTGRGLMSQVYLPKVFFPAVIILRNSAKFLLTLGLLLLFLLAYGDLVSWDWLWLPLLMLLQLALLTGISFTIAAIVPLWPDLMLVVNNGLMLMFFLSGVFFDTSAVEGWLGVLLMLNPMVAIIESWRAVLLGTPFPDPRWLGWTALVAISSAALGLYLLRRYDRYYPRLA